MIFKCSHCDNDILITNNEKGTNSFRIICKKCNTKNGLCTLYGDMLIGYCCERFCDQNSTMHLKEIGILN